MEQQVVEPAAKVAALEEGAGWATTIKVEVFYWWCTALMFIIHAGFLGYEMGASRKKNVLASGIKNILAFAFMIPTFFFGWWLYLASPGGFPDISADTGGAPWSETMGPNLADNATGIFWAVFALFAATTASIFSEGRDRADQTLGLHHPGDPAGFGVLDHRRVLGVAW